MKKMKMPPTPRPQCANTSPTGGIRRKLYLVINVPADALAPLLGRKFYTENKSS